MLIYSHDWFTDLLIYSCSVWVSEWWMNGEWMLDISLYTLFGSGVDLWVVIASLLISKLANWQTGIWLDQYLLTPLTVTHWVTSTCKWPAFNVFWWNNKSGCCTFCTRICAKVAIEDSFVDPFPQAHFSHFTFTRINNTFTRSSYSRITTYVLIIHATFRKFVISFEFGSNYFSPLLQVKTPHTFSILIHLL